MKRHFFKTFEFEFETSRLLWYIPSGGADYGEVATTTEKIKDGDYESWYQEWLNCAKKLEQRAWNFSSLDSKSNAYLRSSRYYQAAEFFLSPKDSRKFQAYQKSVDLFYKALELQQIDYHLETVAYKRAKLRTLYFPLNATSSKGTIFICGGFDALLEELFFTNVKPALANGYEVILYEGPGQSDTIRKYKLPFEDSWNEVSRKVVDFYDLNFSLKNPKIGLGLSLGGLLIARAASLDQALFDKIYSLQLFPIHT